MSAVKNRDISFRGKGSRLNPGFVYGDLIHNPDGGVSIKAEKLSPSQISPYHRVYAETVGQYTGLTDKNGERIFEGDIVKVVAGEGCCDPIVGVIQFENCGFFFKFGKLGKALFSDWVTECYVVGNIHDNPELLEVQ